ncbi:M56 family metallopeptidase [Sphingomonas sp.]|uniref:M56 family metallopeptidase n=1 Tax=Sphingomonas sp. TaxID=28214 RepID=UPI0017EEB6B8|nr:M56 family metallopeptidase [Sphingomonas sp.]MBA3512159.1 M56 family metallopeptidase [Sphingomonas sp.]
MDLLIPIAAKSFLVAGTVLLLLKLAQHRSASDRSWIAHLGLIAILLLPVAALGLPALNVEGPSFLAARAAEAATPVESLVQASTTPALKSEAASPAGTFPADSGAALAAAPVDWAVWAYAAPAGLLLLLTLIALGRLIGLKSRATVMVEPNWLTALARAQRRMGFKHGTALLTSDELPSPISWGVIRPVILLNGEAAQSHREAEAIIAHELAHVASLDWAKLLLSRVTAAMFWFNPLVWVLAREAHQLREEAADDAVLGADIEDTEYAKLLVGIARHECRGLLIGAHGVAPARNSLARRIRRVLDGALERAPGGWRWSTAAAFFAAGMAVPVAAFNVVAPTIATAAEHGRFVPGQAAAAAAAPLAGRLAANASSGSAAGAVSESAAAIAAGAAGAVLVTHPNGAAVTTANGETLLRAPSGATVRVSPPDANGRRRTVMTGPNGSVVTFADARAVRGLAAATAVAAHPHQDAIDRAIEMKAVGATPEYVRAIRNAAPHLRLDHDDIVELKALGVSPDYVRDLARSGYPRLNADSIVEARAMGINGAYIRGIAAAYGYLPMDDLVELKAVGVTPADIARFRRSGHRLPSVHKLVEMKALGINPEDIPGRDDSP